jgi:hypothetical protein
VNLRVDLKIDDSYVPDMNQRLMLSQGSCGAPAEIERVLEGSGRPLRSVPGIGLNLADTGVFAFSRIGWVSTPSTAKAVVPKVQTAGEGRSRGSALVA